MRMRAVTWRFGQTGQQGPCSGHWTPVAQSFQRPQHCFHRRIAALSPIVISSRVIDSLPTPSSQTTVHDFTTTPHHDTWALVLPIPAISTQRIATDTTTKMRTLTLLLSLLFLASPITAQFGSFFDQMFGGGGHGGHGHQHQQQHQGHGQQQHPNVPSDPSIYQANYQRAHCDKYLCPDTLGMSSFPYPVVLARLG